MSDAHGSAGALGSFLHDPFFESDDLLFLERIAYPESAGACVDLGPDTPSFVSGFLPHEGLSEPCNTHIDTDNAEEAACLFLRASATNEPESGTSHVALEPAVEPEATGAAQRLLDLPTAEEMRMQKLRAKNRRSQLAYRKRLKVTLPAQPCTSFELLCQLVTITAKATDNWRRRCVALYRFIASNHKCIWWLQWHRVRAQPS
jgi:hypothetical protein